MTMLLQRTGRVLPVTLTIGVGGAILIFFLTFWVGVVVFRDAPMSTDEHAYLFQMNSFAEGIISRPIPKLFPALFKHEMIIMDDHAGWVSRYPPGHALWLTPGAWLGNPRIMVALAASLGYLVLFHLGRAFNLPSWLLPTLLLFSPFFLLMYGTFLSHTSGLLAVSMLLFCYVKWKQQGNSWYAMAAGLAWSFFFLNRTYTAFLIAIPFGLDAIIDLARKHNRRSFWQTVLFAGFSMLGVAFYLYYNYRVTGDPFLPTFTYYDPSETLGFGPRHTGGIPRIHTFARGLMIMWNFLFQLDHWFLGFTGSLVLTGLLAIAGWNKRWSPLCIGVVVAVWFGYIFFWFEGLPLLGPVYYFETLPFLLLLLAFGLDRFYRMASQWKRVRYMSTILFVFIYVASGLHFLWKRAMIIYMHQDLAGQYHRLLYDAPESSLILVSTYKGMRYFSKGMAYNPKGLSSNPLVVRSGLLQNKLILAAFPGRKPFKIILRNGKMRLVAIKETAPVHYRFTGVNSLAKTGKNLMISQGITQRIALESEDKKGLLVFGKYFFVAPGNYIFTVDLQLKNVRKNHPVLVDVAADYGRTILAQRQVSGSKALKFQLPFHANALIRVEPRIHYGGSGEVVVAGMEIMQEVPVKKSSNPL